MSDLLEVFAAHESQVRSYCRSWPEVFDTARGSRLFTAEGRGFLDFFTGAGALNYGHNHPVLKAALLAYLSRDGVVHALDMHTVAKARLLESLQDRVLVPRGLKYRVLFPGPTGANAVEAALKLARKATGRSGVAYCSGSFHGVSLGALAVTSNPMLRGAAGVTLRDSLRLPFDDPSVSVPEALARFDAALEEAWVGQGAPAAVILECVQGEGGLRVARSGWLAGVGAACRARGIVLIVDDVQMGCGRTGDFFSFTESGLVPDVVVLSKSISGYGLPMALLLVAPELDVFEPGEHNGTFRGHNAAFVTATAALQEFWADAVLARRVAQAGHRVQGALSAAAARAGLPPGAVHGRGLAWGFTLNDPAWAARARDAAFAAGLLVELCGPGDVTVKLMPSLLSTDAELDEGCGILAQAILATA